MLIWAKRHSWRRAALAVLVMVGPAWGQAAAPAAGLKSPASAEICGDCHRAALEAWKVSRHAHAMDSLAFRDVLYYAEKDLGAAERETCLACHSPLALATQDASLQSKISWEGVTCDYCHSIRQVSTAGRNPAAVVELTRVRTGPWKGETPGQHGALASELHTSSLVCAPCHEYRNDLGFPVVATFSEWQASRYAREGRTCQSCHLPSVGRVALVSRIVATPTDVERHSHCQNCHEVGASGAAPQAPAVQAGVRERGRLNLHEMQGSQTTELPASAIWAQLAAVREGGKVKVTVELANRGAGHYVPTGSPLRQMILEVRADTESGQRLVQQRVYGRAAVDREGKPIEREYMAFARGARIISDTRLGPDEKRSETFLFDIPEGAAAQIHAALRISYSPLGKAESQKSATFLTLSTKAP